MIDLNGHLVAATLCSGKEPQFPLDIRLGAPEPDWTSCGSGVKAPHIFGLDRDEWLISCSSFLIP